MRILLFTCLNLLFRSDEKKKRERERETCEAQNALPKCSLYVTLLLLLACVSQIRWVGQVIGVSNYLV